MIDRSLAQLRRQRERAGSYAEWLALSEQLDQRSGAQAWRRDPDCAELASDLLQQDMRRLQRLTRRADLPALAEALHESVYRHQGDINAPHLYQQAAAGTKQIIEDYLTAVCAALQCFADAETHPMPRAQRLALLQRAQANLGRPALLLSGGAAMGFFHLGVIKALFEQGLLPEVICGSSIGALIGGGVCTRNDEELAALFANLETIYRFGIRFFGPREIWRKRSLLDPAQLGRCAEENLGLVTFAEAAAHSGRQFCISVSPARARQKPRVLSAQTSPDVLVANAVLASSAIPGLFPPVGLQMRKANGKVVPYLPAERWVDGTFHGDLPAQRLARLHNVNHCIVSQVNPHALPFLSSRSGRGPLSLVSDLLLSSARVQTAQLLKVVQARVRGDRLHTAIEHARLLAEQNYRGDTSIHPPINAWMYRKMLSNPSVDDLKRYIRLGEQATWPKIALIRNQTRIHRTLNAVVSQLQGAA